MSLQVATKAHRGLLPIPIKCRIGRSSPEQHPAPSLDWILVRLVSLHLERMVEWFTVGFDMSYSWSYLVIGFSSQNSRLSGLK